MRCLLAILAVLILGSPTVAAGADLNPPHGDPAYRRFTVFSPDAAGPEAVRDDVIVVFHGLTSAVPNGTFKRVRKLFLQSHTVIGINYDPLDIDRTRTFLDRVAADWLPGQRGRRAVIFGTSMGAIWADYFGHRIGAPKVVLLNPVTDPATQLSSHVGTVRNERRNEAMLIEQATLDRYGELETAANTATSRLVVLTSDDGAFDYRTAFDAFVGRDRTDVLVFATGGHTIDLRKHAARRFIRAFVLND